MTMAVVGTEPSDEVLPAAGGEVDTEVVELVLLVTGEDASGLERAAGDVGVTVASLLRLLIRQHLGLGKITRTTLQMY